MHPRKNKQNLLSSLALPSFLFYWLLVFMYWSANRDPLSKTWFKLQAAQGDSFECVSIVPKAKGSYPVVVVAANSGNFIAGNGKLLRRIADIGLGVIAFQADRQAQAKFDHRVDAVMLHLRGQKWSSFGPVGWLGIDDTGAQILAYLSRHPTPGAFVQWNAQAGRAAPAPVTRSGALAQTIFSGSPANTPDVTHVDGAVPHRPTPPQIQSLINTANLAGKPDSLTQAAINRSVAEHFFRILEKDPRRRLHMVKEQGTRASGMAILVGLGLMYGIFLIRGSINLQRLPTLMHRPGKAVHGSLFISGLAASLAIGITAFHLLLLQFPVSVWSMTQAARFFIPEADREDFIHTCETANWRETRIGVAISNARLCAYNRQLVPWPVSPDMYRDFVLSPSITGNSHETFAWRRALWEHLHPAVKHLKQKDQVAAMIPQLMRQHLVITDEPSGNDDVGAILRTRITDQKGFAAICVAALRAAGVPARLNPEGRAEYYSTDSWRAVPPAQSYTIADALQFSL